MLADTARRLVGPRRAALGWGLAGALLLAVPDLARQLPVRDDPSRLHALLVDAVGFLSGGMLQLALVGLLAGEPARRWLTSGVLLLGEALRRRPGTVLTGLVAAGGVSALLTLPPSIAALGWRQVLGPLNDPSLSALAVAQLSDVVATALTAPYFALLVARCAGRAP